MLPGGAREEPRVARSSRRVTASPRDESRACRRGWLGSRDSNPDRRIQSPLSYHWTTPQRVTAQELSRSGRRRPRTGVSRGVSPGCPGSSSSGIRLRHTWSIFWSTTITATRRSLVRMRNLIGQILCGIGMTGLSVSITKPAAHLAYGGPISWRNGIQVMVASVILLLIGSRLLPLPPRVVVFLVTAFGGLALAVMPIRHTGFWGWGVPDVLLLLIGGSLLGSSYLWYKRMTAANRTRRRRPELGTLPRACHSQTGNVWTCTALARKCPADGVTGSSEAAVCGSPGCTSRSPSYSPSRPAQVRARAGARHPGHVNESTRLRPRSRTARGSNPGLAWPITPAGLLACDRFPRGETPAVSAAGGVGVRAAPFRFEWQARLVVPLGSIGTRQSRQTAPSSTHRGRDGKSVQQTRPLRFPGQSPRRVGSQSVIDSSGHSGVRGAHILPRPAPAQAPLPFSVESFQ